MNSFSSMAAAAAILLAIGSTTANAAQDYNSSRSNNSSAIAAPDEVDNLLELTRTEASAVARSMVAADQRDGYSGEYTVTDEVSVSIERAPRGKSEKRRSD